jgi:hypothetical protein
VIARDIVAALQGFWRLLRLDPQGLRSFDRTPAGYWRSWAALACAWPAGLTISFALRPELFAEHGFWRVALVQLLLSVTFLAGYALLVIQLARSIGRAERALDFLVPYNWAQAPGSVLLALAALVGSGAAVPLDLIALAWYAFYGYLGYVGLGAGIGAAVAVALLDLVLSALLFRIGDGLY